MLSVPITDHEALARLTEKARQDLLTRIKIMEAIDAAPNKSRACREQAAALHGRSGMSAPTLYRNFFDWKRDGWRGLVNASLDPAFSERKEAPLSEKFVTHWLNTCLARQRGKARAARRALLLELRRWRAGDPRSAIPGYDVPPPDAEGHDHPAGWSEGNLGRLRPTRFQQAAMNIGRGRAADFRPQVLTTRVGLQPGQIVCFDDQVHDVRVNFIGNRRKAQRPLELCALDVFSACFIAHGFKPTVWNDITETRVMLRQEDMVWFAVHWLLDVGYREDTGTQVICEHGTAAFPDWLRAKIDELSAGKITFVAGGVDRRASFPGMFDGPARGNFRIKAGLESSFNLVRNETDHLIGQVGKDRDHAPEQWEAQLRHNERLLLAETLLPKIAGMLRTPLLEWNQFIRDMLGIYDLIDHRQEHDLEGWLKADLIAREWRPQAALPWLPADVIEAMAPEERRAVLSLVDSNPSALARVRKLSPREVWSRRSGLTRPPGHWLPLLLPAEPPYAVERVVQDNHTFEFCDQEITPEPMRFLAEVRGEFLRPGQKFMTFVNPFRPDALYVCDGKGRYLGECRPWHRVCKSDTDAIHRRCGEAKAIESRLLGPVALAGAALTRSRTEDAQHNARVIREAAAQVLENGKADQRKQARDLSGVPDMGDLVESRETSVESQNHPSLDAIHDPQTELYEVTEANDGAEGLL